MTIDNLSQYRKGFLISKEELEQRYLEQIELILDNPNEKIWSLTLPDFDLKFFGYSSKMEFEEEVLKPIIHGLAKKRELDFDFVCNVVSHGINWEGHY